MESVFHRFIASNSSWPSLRLWGKSMFNSSDASVCMHVFDTSLVSYFSWWKTTTWEQFFSFRLLGLLFGTAWVGFSALKYVLVTFFLLVDRSFCACGKIPELFKKYMIVLKIYLYSIFPHDHTYSGITGNWNKLPACLAFHSWVSSASCSRVCAAKKMFLG